MKTVKVVIGANFGDEGKGLMTDYFAAGAEKPIVVRFNGGSQAGHTVVRPDGKEHVFSHFGSGTLAGAPTYLSEYFLVNPIMFRKEQDELEAKVGGRMPAVFVDQDAQVTTPYDMLLNQAAETFREGSRHGSCGLGISETVVRGQSSGGKYRILYRDLQDLRKVREILDRIREEYVPGRLAELGIGEVPEPFASSLANPRIIEAYIWDCSNVFLTANLCDHRVLNWFQSVVFEGAQGLLLDEDGKYAPHVTHSKTGMANVTKILKRADWNYDLEVVYATRCYLTRHGAGPFPTEIGSIPYRLVRDLTNVPNEWQGALRYGVLDLNELSDTIFADLVNNTEFWKDIKMSLAVTCLDQVDESVRFIVDGIETFRNVNTFIAKLGEWFKPHRIYTSWGRSREHVTFHSYAKEEKR